MEIKKKPQKRKKVTVIKVLTPRKHKVQMVSEAFSLLRNIQPI